MQLLIHHRRQIYTISKIVLDRRPNYPYHLYTDNLCDGRKRAYRRREEESLKWVAR